MDEAVRTYIGFRLLESSIWWASAYIFLSIIFILALAWVIVGDVSEDKRRVDAEGYGNLESKDIKGLSISGMKWGLINYGK